MINNYFAKPYSVCILTVLLIFIILNNPAEIKSQSAFHICAQNEFSDNLTQIFASDNINLYIATEKGQILSIDKTTFKLNWSADIGGEITGLTYGKKIIYTISKPSESDNDFFTFTLRVLSAETGLSIKSIKVSSEQILPVTNSSRILFLTKNKQSISLINEQLETVWTTQIVNNAKISYALLFENSIYSIVGKTIYSINISDGTPNIPLNSNERLTSLQFSQPANIVYADDKGNVFTYDSRKKRNTRSYKTGAAVESVDETTEGILVNSDDNFIYLISRRGSLKWKQRFDNNISELQTSNDRLLANASRENTLYLLDLKNGKILNKFQFEGLDQDIPVKMLSENPKIGEDRLTTDRIVFRKGSKLFALCKES